MNKTLIFAACAALGFGAVMVEPMAAAEEKPATQPAESQTPKVKPEEAKAHMGKEVIVEAKVTSTRRTDKACFINFSKDKTAFYVVIFDPALSSASEAPEMKYDKKKIQVKGTVSEHKGKPQIVVKDLAQITVVEEK